MEDTYVKGQADLFQDLVPLIESVSTFPRDSSLILGLRQCILGEPLTPRSTREMPTIDISMSRPVTPSDLSRQTSLANLPAEVLEQVYFALDLADRLAFSGVSSLHANGNVAS